MDLINKQTMMKNVSVSTVAQRLWPCPVGAIFVSCNWGRFLLLSGFSKGVFLATWDVELQSNKCNILNKKLRSFQDSKIFDSLWPRNSTWEDILYFFWIRRFRRSSNTDPFFVQWSLEFFFDPFGGQVHFQRWLYYIRCHSWRTEHVALFLLLHVVSQGPHMFSWLLSCTY